MEGSPLAASVKNGGRKAGEAALEHLLGPEEAEEVRLPITGGSPKLPATTAHEARALTAARWDQEGGAVVGKCRGSEPVSINLYLRKNILFYFYLLV